MMIPIGLREFAMPTALAAVGLPNFGTTCPYEAVVPTGIVRRESN